MDAKRDAKSHTFGWKNGPRASLVRPKTALYSISESSEKRWFFGVISERPKIDKKKTRWSLKGPKVPLSIRREEERSQFPESGSPGRRPIIKEIDESMKKNNKDWGGDPNTPLGRWPGEFCCFMCFTCFLNFFWLGNNLGIFCYVFLTAGIFCYAISATAW